MASFENPWLLLLLLIVPPAIWLRHLWRGRAGLVALSFALAQGRQFRPPPSAWRVLAAITVVVFWLGVSLIIVSIAGPTNINRERVYLNRGLEIILLVDVSPSMAAQDVAGKNRLQQATETLNNFIAKRGSDGVGVVAFGTDASLQCPVTQDYATVRDRLGQLRPNMLGEGTSIGLGLAVAAVHFSPDRTRDKVVVLVSDGDNNAGEISPAAGIELLKNAGIRVYSVGLGSDREVYLEYAESETGRRISGTYKGVLDESLLRSVASSTGGKYFFAGNGLGLDSVLESIDSSEQVQSEVRLEVRKEPLAALFLVVGLGLILLDMGIRRLILRELA